MAKENWVTVAEVADLPDDSMMAVDVDDREILICNIGGGELCATDNVCTHEFARLSDGILDGDVIECPLHAGQFDLRTGKGLCEPITVDLRTFPIRITDDKIEVDVGE